MEFVRQGGQSLSVPAFDALAGARVPQPQHDCIDVPMLVDHVAPELEQVIDGFRVARAENEPFRAEVVGADPEALRVPGGECRSSQGKLQGDIRSDTPGLRIEESSLYDIHSLSRGVGGQPGVLAPVHVSFRKRRACREPAVEQAAGFGNRPTVDLPPVLRQADYLTRVYTEGGSPIDGVLPSRKPHIPQPPPRQREVRVEEYSDCSIPAHGVPSFRDQRTGCPRLVAAASIASR